MTETSLIDLEIEDSLSRETLMNIDSSNTKEDCITISLFIFLMFVIFCIGLFSPPSEQTIISKKLFSEKSKIASFLLDNLSEWNHFLYISFNVIVSDSFKSDDFINVKYEASLSFLQNGQIVASPKQIERIVNMSLLPGTNESDAIEILYDHYPIYSEVKAIIKVVSDSNNILGLKLNWNFGDVNHPIVQIWFRYMFAIMCLIAFLMLLCRLGKLPFRHWHLEQKITSFLVLFCILADNPLYIQQLIWPSHFGAWANLAFLSVFRVYLRFFIIVLFDSLRYKNRKLQKCFFIPKILLSILDLITDIVVSVSNSKEIPDIITHDQAEIVFNARNIVLSIYIIWAVFSIVKAFAFIDITEKYKITVYTILSSISLIISGLTSFVFGKIQFFNKTSISFLVSFSVQNFFVVLMVVFHWPYELITDQQYHDSTINNKIDDFFVNTE